MAAKNPAKTASGTKPVPSKRRSAAKQAAPGTDPKPVGRGAMSGVTAEERYKMIAYLAFLRAEKRGFAPGNEMDDWLQAEAEIEQLLRGG